MKGFQKGNQYGRMGKGRKFTAEHSRRISDAQIGDKNHRWRGGPIEFKCVVCDKLFKRRKNSINRSSVKCCSLKCLGQYNSINHSGHNHYNWKGGKTIIHDRIRRSLKYRIWRKEVFERDNYTCQECGTKISPFHPHHVPPFELSKIIDYLKHKYNTTDTEVLYEGAMKLEFLWNKLIGKTLCVDCHKLTDSYKNQNNENKGNR